jgi:hypothetical protein
MTRMLTRIPNHRNINVFGLVFIITTSLSFAILDILLLKFLIYLSTFRKALALAPRIEQWIQHSVLQLQRRAYEAIEQGTWSNLDGDIPLTEPNALLPVLPLDYATKTTSNATTVSPSTWSTQTKP